MSAVPIFMSSIYALGNTVECISVCVSCRICVPKEALLYVWLSQNQVFVYYTPTVRTPQDTSVLHKYCDILVALVPGLPHSSTPKIEN